MPKTHLEGEYIHEDQAVTVKSACGVKIGEQHYVWDSNLPGTQDPTEVTCERCKQTDAWEKALKENTMSNSEFRRFKTQLRDD